MCHFQHGTIECRGDGFCWDADCDGYDPSDHSMPCPVCNTLAWLMQQKEEAETTSFFQGIDSGTGVTIWENAVDVARRENPEHADRLLNEIGHVKALYEDDDDKVLVREFIYPSPSVSAAASAT
jgi:hypothetical protein